MLWKRRSFSLNYLKLFVLGQRANETYILVFSLPNLIDLFRPHFCQLQNRGFLTGSSLKLLPVLTFGVFPTEWPYFCKVLKIMSFIKALL